MGAAAVIADRLLRKSLRTQRIFRDRGDPLDGLLEHEVKHRYRFRRDTIFHLCDRIGAKLRSRTEKNGAVPVLHQVLVGLRFLSCGTYYLMVGDLVKVSESSVCRIIHRFYKAVCELTPQEISLPDKRSLPEISAKFYRQGMSKNGRRPGIPNVTGCVDGSLIEIEKPPKNTHEFMCRKGHAAINIQVMCGPDNIVYQCSVRWPGSVHDAKIFDNSGLPEAYMSGLCHIKSKTQFSVWFRTHTQRSHRSKYCFCRR